jgi:hypothetical protein
MRLAALRFDHFWRTDPSGNRRCITFASMTRLTSPNKSKALSPLRLIAVALVAAVTLVGLPHFAAAANPALVKLTVHYQRADSEVMQHSLLVVTTFIRQGIRLPG